MDDAAFRPPEKYAHLRWHWVVAEHRDPFPAQWEPSKIAEGWRLFGGWSGSKALWANHVRYHAPCDPAVTVPDPESAEMTKAIAMIIDPRAWEVENDPTVDCNLYQNARAASLHKARAILAARRDMGRSR